MEVEAALDVPFLAGLLDDLANLNVREFASDQKLLAACIVRLLQRVFRWFKERPDNWRDAKSLAYGSFLCDCEDIAAMVGAILSMIYEDVYVGIKLVTPNLCHAIVKVGKKVVDFCPLLGMPRGDGSPKPVMWKKLPDNRNLVVRTDEGTRKVIDVGAELVSIFFESRKKPADVLKELDNAVKEASEDDNTVPETSGESDVNDTGASWADTLAGYLVPGSLISKVTALEKDAKDWKKKYDGMAAEKSKLAKQLAAEQQAHNNTKKASADRVANLQKECDGAKAKLRGDLGQKNAEIGQKNARIMTSDQKALELEKALAAANVLAAEQKKQIDELSKRASDSNQERIAELKARIEAPDYAPSLAQSFVEDPFAGYEAFYAIEAAGYVLQNEKPPCCDDCAKGLPCSGTTCGHSHDTGDHTHDTGSEGFVSGGNPDYVSDLSELDTGSVVVAPPYKRKCDTGCPL